MNVRSRSQHPQSPDTMRDDSRHFDFLSVGEEFDADCPGRTHCMVEVCGHPSSARSATVSLMGGTTNIRKPSGAMVRGSRATKFSERSFASAIRAGSRYAG